MKRGGDVAEVGDFVEGIADGGIGWGGHDCIACLLQFLNVSAVVCS